MLVAFWFDETGAVLTVELVIILTVVVLALVVGLTALRDALVTELGDVSASIGSLNQSYSFGGIVGHCAATAGSFWLDQPDVSDDVGSQSGGSGCIVVCAVAATPEGQPATIVSTDQGTVTFQPGADGDDVNIRVSN
jgi:hypothetical protein